MGDTRFDRLYRHVREASDTPGALRELADEEIIAALAAASKARDSYFANVLASEAMNRVRRKSTIVEAAEEGMYSLDDEGCITYMNPAAERLVGWTLAEALGKDAHALLHCTDLGGGHVERAHWIPARVMAGGSPTRGVESAVVRRDGVVLPVVLTCAPIVRAGEREGAVVTFTDISDRKRWERRLRESEQRYRSLFELNPDIVAWVDPLGNLVELNPAIQGLLGYSPEELEGKPLTTLMLPEDHAHVLADLHQVLSGETRSTEFRATHRDGRVVHFHAKAIPIVLEGDVVGVFGIAKDVTTEKELAERVAMLEGERENRADRPGAGRERNPTRER